MGELKILFSGLDGGMVYLGLLLASLVAVKLKFANAASLFIWCCSVPPTIFCYIVWLYASGGYKWSPAMLLIEALALAQLGWLGGGLALVGGLIEADILKKVALWISIGSVICHGLFLASIYVFGYGSS
ncbi:hypothetical protein [Pseudomonas fluorescens]|uniref:hypothetical protein n=1 Tax=Pseudomonas fluorescens TaxID=294 RepID=UPI000731FEDC|nr:hypothetical protein [Pseudomonas fluorescens]